jgi:hypothetical protein
MMITAGQAKTARKLLGWTQKRCAGRAGVGLAAVVHFEVGRKPILRTREAIRKAFEAAGLQFMRSGEVSFKERK